MPAWSTPIRRKSKQPEPTYEQELSSSIARTSSTVKTTETWQSPSFTDDSVGSISSPSTATDIASSLQTSIPLIRTKSAPPTSPLVHQRHRTNTNKETQQPTLASLSRLKPSMSDTLYNVGGYSSPRRRSGSILYGQWLCNELIPTFAVKFVLEVLGGAGAIWGFSEAAGFRTEENSISIFRPFALSVGFLFFLRWIYQLGQALENPQHRRQQDTFMTPSFVQELELREEDCHRPPHSRLATHTMSSEDEEYDDDMTPQTGHTKPLYFPSTASLQHGQDPELALSLPPTEATSLRSPATSPMKSPHRRNITQ